jgi:hypothetical protein
MNVLSGILTVAAIGFGVTSVYLYSELDAARSEVNARIAPCLEAQAQIPAWQQAYAELDTVQREELLAEDPVDGSREPAVGRLHGIRDEGPTEATGRQATSTAHEFSRPRHEAMLRRMYGGVAKDLNLSLDQEAEIIALLLEHQTEQIETVRRLAGDRTAMAGALNDLRSENSTELMTALGDKYLQFEDYQKTLGERMQIEQASLQLEAAGVPMRDDQHRRLLDVMVDERERLPRPAWTAGMPPEQMMVQQRAWQDDYDQRVRDRLTGVLTSEQLKQYDVHRNLQATQRRRQLETWRESNPQSLSRAPSSAM